MEDLTFRQKLYKKFWHFIYKTFLGFQKILFKWGIRLSSKERYPYHIGWFNPLYTLDELKIHLHTNWGFGNHFVSLIEEGQVLSWRKFLLPKYQYHIKVFEDGEIRGAVEYMPEKNILFYFMQKHKKPAKEEFFNFLGDFVVNEKKTSVLEMEKGAYVPSAEETF